ncbi:right-handed parallel beta-helix repeat-containing protein [Tuwongella immobilis]|uniref:Pectate lyase superfamily protein domain-containing protein n=1 Tax=Tuwongella immobilis TaxID=692036 RepID=A0A6C2YKD6_9BACT|nr:right-handed parallel beta-helix repeat-containing protein [Tuwongella immobilis]VIP02038.1 pre-neck appendage protein : Uncharacterized protein OS=Singulisphaera acidiphila (strain ATCC BAA-1392 / DSM 18658 / VKM B-2454 / MOB10) GN=Sinac_3948 PE=4 SV=1: Pectate_lyase_3 [Tuwongella immobilis]VTS00201.1 pre-neck appendage protein : Uncharacterized protein OS=Singulisphaera acidiphila (strain ATCC BAA-1392 / DSM 18658 / VKM B-2454 / MOB10) GN=Sinac_3948 PE=4 SV=1: Pectate_lyase_3 [Tuwongella imm
MASVREFGAKGDGLADDTAAFQHAIERGDGLVQIPRGNYRITRPILIPLKQFGRLAIVGESAATLHHHAAGPCFHLIGTHGGSALPKSVLEPVWQSERMPLLRDFEILGHHAQADGIRLEGVMQPTLHGVLIRKCRHGIHLVQRNRNVLITACHIYDNSGIGIFLDRLNLHQINITGNHISYCKRGGISISQSEIRNIQIVGNDIEYNHDFDAPESTDIRFDASQGTIREGTIVGNTIQAQGSKGGANIRLIGVGASDPNAVGLLAITGNLIGSQTTAIEMTASRGVTISGNCIYSGYESAIDAKQCEHLVISGNTIDHNPEYKGNSTDRLRFVDCRNVSISGTIVQHTLPPTIAVDASLQFIRCKQLQIQGLQVLNARVRGIQLIECERVGISQSTIQRKPDDPEFVTAIDVQKCQQIMLTHNFLSKSQSDSPLLPKGSGLAESNLTID